MQTIYLTPHDNDLIGKLRRDEALIAVFCDTEVGDFTVYLPRFLSASDKVFVFYNSGSNTVTLNARGEYINGAETFSITSTMYSAIIIADTGKYRSLDASVDATISRGDLIIPEGKAIYFCAATTDTSSVGTLRMKKSGNDILTERWDGAAWV